MDRFELEKIFRSHGCEDFVWIRASEIETAQWVRMKCAYGCRSYGKKADCPPNAPAFEECVRFFSEYDHCVLFHFQVRLEDPETRGAYTKEVNGRLLEIEREVFLKNHPKAFLFFMDECRLCVQCAGTPSKCPNPGMARPSPESFCVDVFSTAKKCGYPLEVLKDYRQEMHRYAILMVE